MILTAACGGDSSTTASTATAAPKQVRGAGSTASKTKEQEEAVASLRNFGHEASSSEARQIEAAMHAYLDARVGGEWSKACSYLAKSNRHLFSTYAAKSQEVSGEGCAAGMSALLGSSSSKRAGFDKANVSAVRVKGDRAFAIFSSSGSEYAMAMGSEGGEWKVAASTPTPLGA